MYESATVLQREARLKIVPAAPIQLPLYDDFSRPPGETPPYQPSSGVVHVSDYLSTSVDSYNSSSKRDYDTNESTSMVSNCENIGSNNDNNTTTNTCGELPPTPNLRLTKIRHNATPSQTPKVSNFLV